VRACFCVLTSGFGVEFLVEPAVEGGSGVFCPLPSLGGIGKLERGGVPAAGGGLWIARCGFGVWGFDCLHGAGGARAPPTNNADKPRKTP